MSDIYQDRQLEAIASRWDAKAKTWESELENPACHLNEDAAYERFLGQARATITRRRRGFAQKMGSLMLAVAPVWCWRR